MQTYSRYVHVVEARMAQAPESNKQDEAGAESGLKQVDETGVAAKETEP